MGILICLQFFFPFKLVFIVGNGSLKKKRRIVVFNKKERVASFLYICEMWCKRRVNDHYIEPQFLFCSCILLFKQTLFFLIKVYCFLFFFVFSFFSSKHYRIPIRPQLKNVKKVIVFAILAKCAALFLFFFVVVGSTVFQTSIAILEYPTDIFFLLRDFFLSPFFWLKAKRKTLFSHCLVYSAAHQLPRPIGFFPSTHTYTPNRTRASRRNHAK